MSNEYNFFIVFSGRGSVALNIATEALSLSHSETNTHEQARGAPSRTTTFMGRLDTRQRRRAAGD